MDSRTWYLRRRSTRSRKKEEKRREGDEGEAIEIDKKRGNDNDPGDG
jgi:hypothetical protein